MKKHFKEIVLLVMQLLVFYILPLSAGPADMMGLVVLIILLTFIIGLLVGLLSNHNKKYLFPIIIAILFIPSIFIYYNESALIYIIWFLVDSFLGLGLGILLKKVFKR